MRAATMAPGRTTYLANTASFVTSGSPLIKAIFLLSSEPVKLSATFQQKRPKNHTTKLKIKQTQNIIFFRSYKFPLSKCFSAT